MPNSEQSVEGYDKRWTEQNTLGLGDRRRIQVFDANDEQRRGMKVPADQDPGSSEVGWPVPGDYGDALIHIAWLVVQKKRYLIFGLVELFPSEPPPPDETPEATFAYRDQGVMHRVYVQRQRLSAAAALSWYGDCRSGKVLLPGDGQQNGSPKVLETAAFSNHPPWPTVVAANNLAFVSRTWGTVRIHPLMPVGPCSVTFSDNPSSVCPALATIRTMVVS